MKSKILKVASSVFFISLLTAVLFFVKGCIFLNPFTGLLVSGESLEANLGISGLIIIDARTSGYDEAHIPGAINILFSDPDYIDDGMKLKPIADLERKLSEEGLSRDMIFVIYDNTTASWGAAGRVFWMLEYLGCSQVHLLNGGWDKWLADGRQTETTANILPAATFVADVQEDVLMGKDYLESKLGDNDFVIIDSRTEEEYNGWILYGEERGGHIPGALQIPYASFFKSDKTILDYQELKELLESRGITTDKEVTSYCTAGIRSGFVYFVLRLMGYPKASNYDGSMFEWSSDQTLPMDSGYENVELLYPVSLLIQDVADEIPPTIIDCRSEEAYQTGHIPGAVNLQPSALSGEDMPKNLLADNEIASILGDNGISGNETVIIYTEVDGAWGADGRMFWVLEYMGHPDVHILNGGWAAWQAGGGAIETTINTPTATTYLGTVGVSVLATKDYIFEHLGDSSVVVVDSRSQEEYDGEILYGEARGGHIPGAVHYDYATYFDADWTLKNHDELEAVYQSLGATSDKEAIIFYCTVGLRSGFGYFASRLLGFTTGKNYDGSWWEWAADEEMPVE